MADVSTATSYMISDLPVKQAPSSTDIFLLEDAEGNAYQVPASALALSSEDVTAAINAWLAAHPEATTTVTDGSITMQKLAIDVTGAFQSLSDDIDDLETALGNKVPYPQTGGVNDYGTAGQALLSKGDGTTEWGAGGGLSDEAKDAILEAFEHVAWIDGQGQEYVDAIRDAFYPPVHATSVTLNKSSLSFTALNQSQTLVATVLPADATDAVVWTSSDNTVATVNNGVVTTVAYGTATITATAGSVSATCSVVVAQATLTSISAVYTQSGTVYDTDSLDSLKTDLVVTATYSDSTTATIAATDYTLSGTLTEGTSTITVTYGGKTDTFSVTVTHAVTDTTAKIASSGKILTHHSGVPYYRESIATNGGITIKYSMPSATSILYPAGIIPTDAVNSMKNSNVAASLVVYDDNDAEVSFVNELSTSDFTRWVQNVNATMSEFSQSWDISGTGTYTQIAFSVDMRYLDDAYMYDVTTGTVFFAGINTPYYGMSNISEASV